MELKLARTTLESKPKKINLDKIESEIESSKQKIYYFDKENTHKDLVALVDHFEERGCGVYLREVKYGLNENDYMYEVHIL
jgi:hypothetical protein